MLNATSVSSLVFLLFAAGMWQMAGGFSEMGRFFPQVVASMLVLFSIAQLAVSMAQQQKETPFAGVEIKRLVAMICGMAAYVVLMVYAGFVISSTLFLSFFFWFLSRGREGKFSLSVAIFLAVGVSVGFYSLFHYVFSVPLPVGVFFGD